MTTDLWFTHALSALGRRFTAAGYKRWPKARVSIGWPRSATVRVGDKRLEVQSQVYDGSLSGGVAQVYISPAIGCAADVLVQLLHQLAHLVVGIEHAHDPEFVRCAESIGLAAPWAYPTASPQLMGELERLSKTLGPYPHKAVILTPVTRRQGTRLRLWECPQCHLKVRIGRDEVQLKCVKCDRLLELQ